ncbi:high mobility group box domain-containing protein, partial [Mycena epipterygia]
IPRPRNAFICFRSDYVKAEKRVSARPGSLDQTVMSRGAGDVWRGMGEAERLPYIRMAQAEKKAHTLKYPNYRY